MPIPERGFCRSEDGGDIRTFGSGVIGVEFVLEYETACTNRSLPHKPMACMRRIAHIGWHRGNAVRIEHNAAVACGADDIDAVDNMFDVAGQRPTVLAYS